MIIIHAFIKIDPTHHEEFLEQASEVIAGSQAEEGNISYQLCQLPATEVAGLCERISLVD